MMDSGKMKAMQTLAKSVFGLCVLVLVGCARPMATFSVTDQEDLRAPARVSFNNTSSNAEYYEWDFGDGTVSQASNPEHLFAEAGTYLVSLKAYKNENKVSESYQQVQIIGPDACLVELSTEFGTMLIELYDATPLHRDNFLKLVREEFYDDLLFHRVIKGFMIQGGDPNSRGAAQGAPLGSGGPGYTIPAEFVDTLVHIKGALAAARTGDAVNPERRSSGSQFYIVDGRQVSEQMLQTVEARNDFRYAQDDKEIYLQMGGTPALDQNYTVFGRVISGLSVIDRISSVRTNPRDRPREDVKMTMRIVRYFPQKAAAMENP
jgi:cyclophilin family peptidyl-prolyl cis-trans isomerase